MAYYKQISSTTQIKQGAGKLKGIFVSSVSGSPTITVYDELQGGTTRVMLNTFTPAAATMYPISGDDNGVFFTNGLYVVIAATVECTFMYE